MLSQAAIILALAFWQPYSTTPVCPDGVSVHDVPAYGTAASVPGPAYTRRDNGELTSNCDIYVTAEWLRQPRAVQCAFVARALGTSWFGLDASSDRANVMYSRRFVVPGACQRR
jgi:hypothetical protein